MRLRLRPHGQRAASLPPVLLGGLRGQVLPPEGTERRHACAQRPERDRGGIAGWACNANNGEAGSPLPRLRVSADVARRSSPLPGLLRGLRDEGRVRLCLPGARGLRCTPATAYPVLSCLSGRLRTLHAVRWDNSIYRRGVELPSPEDLERHRLIRTRLWASLADRREGDARHGST